MIAHGSVLKIIRCWLCRFDTGDRWYARLRYIVKFLHFLVVVMMFKLAVAGLMVSFFKCFPMLYEMFNKSSFFYGFICLICMSDLYYLGAIKTKALFSLRQCISDQRFSFFAYACY